MRVRHILGLTLFDYRDSPPACGLLSAIVPGRHASVEDARAAIERGDTPGLLRDDDGKWTATVSRGFPLSPARLRGLLKHTPGDVR